MNKYYSEITYADILVRKSDQFTDVDLQLLQDYNMAKIYINSGTYLEAVVMISTTGYTRIYKGLDEWYYLHNNINNNPLSSIFYKCDQMEGLLMCLNDNLCIMK